MTSYRPARCNTSGQRNSLASNLSQTSQLRRKYGLDSKQTPKASPAIECHWQGTSLHYSVFNITEEDGLRSDDVNRTVIAGGNVWAATARGLSFFPEAYTGRSSVPPIINITRIAVAGEPVRVEGSPTVNYQSGKLLLELAGISYRSGRHVEYEYRLKGTDSSWNRLTGNTIEVPTLSFGRFVLEVRTIDRWGGRSKAEKHPPFSTHALFTDPGDSLYPPISSSPCSPPRRTICLLSSAPAQAGQRIPAAEEDAGTRAVGAAGTDEPPFHIQLPDVDSILYPSVRRDQCQRLSA